MSAMTPVDSPSDLLACVAAFGRSLDESFDPGRSLSEFSARTQRLVPHDYMVIALLEDRGQTYSLFAEYAVRGSLPGDDRRYTTAFERGARVAAESFPLAPVFGGEPQLIGDVTTDDRFREATACREALDEAGLRAVLAVPLFAGGRVGGALVVMSTTAGLYTEAHASACRQVADLIAPLVESVVALHREPRRRERLAAATALAPILGASLKVGDVLERLGEAMRPLIDFDTMGLALRAADGPGFERSEIIGVRRPGYATTPAVEDYSTLERVSRGEIILVRDARRELDPGRAGDRYLIESGDRSVLGVPLLFGEESGGGLFFVTAREHWYDSAAHRRGRDRQGGSGAGDPSRESASRGTIRRPQLRCAAGNLDRVRAVRPRARGLHRRRQAQAWPVRAGSRRHTVSRRDRRARPGRAGKALTRAPGTTVRASRRHDDAGGRHPSHRGHQSGPRAWGGRRAVPRRSLLPTRGVPHPSASSARTRRRRPAPRGSLRASTGRQHGQARARPQPGGARSARGALVAR